MCDSCEGSRLKREALYFKIDDKNILELKDGSGFFTLKINKDELEILRNIVKVNNN